MRTIILFIVLLFPLQIIAQTPVPPGPVSGTWNLSGSPYMVNGEIYIDQGSSLTIEPGVQVRFTGWYKFIVDGSLIANGTATDSILFTADDTTTRWHGIRIIQNSSTISVDYCIVSYGRTDMTEPNFPENAGGGICIYNSLAASIAISNTSIRHNQAYYGGGIQCDGANAVIDNCEITYNTCLGRGGGIQYYSNCNPSLTNSTLSYNYAPNGGGLTCDVDCQLEMIGNRIIHNSADVHGGGIDIWDAGGLNAKGNLFAYNSAQWGGGIAIYTGENLEFSDNTIAYNVATSLGHGGGVYSYIYNTPSFTSDIIYFNTQSGSPNQVHLMLYALPSFNYCNIEGDTSAFTGHGGSGFSGVYENCIDEDPLFEDAIKNVFSLSWNNYPHVDSTRSPCIDAGCPGLPDPDNTCNDIGAYIFYQQLDIPEALPPDSISNYGFLAAWTSAFGALGYYLDIALDDEFTNIVYEGIEIVSNTTYFVEGLNGGTQYYYRVKSYNNALTSDYSNTQMAITLSVSIDEQDIIDDVVIYPNPFINSTTCSFTLHKPTDASIMIFNSQGQLIENIEQAFDQGEQQIRWNVEGLPAGIYYFIISDGEKVQSEKIVLMN